MTAVQLSTEIEESSQVSVETKGTASTKNILTADDRLQHLDYINKLDAVSSKIILTRRRRGGRQGRWFRLFTYMLNQAINSKGGSCKASLAAEQRNEITQLGGFDHVTGCPPTQQRRCTQELHLPARCSHSDDYARCARATTMKKSSSLRTPTLDGNQDNHERHVADTRLILS
ncbi:hypothetical protein BDZ89DRAFT_1035593 [Hymenopellis radicata]|nr:hypothetical protein BDZ89DRAFT_1035593 [Hymenopellis radicata]